MKAEAQVIAACIACATLAGCASNKMLTVTYHSNPEGAVIIQNNRAIGYAPVQAQYNPPRVFNEGGCGEISETAALWQSGATTVMPKITVCKQNTYAQSVVFQRPNAPGMDVDLGTAAAQQAERAAKQADTDETRQSNMEALGALIGTWIGIQAGK